VDNSVNRTYKSNFINHKKVNYVLKKYQLILGQTIENRRARPGALFFAFAFMIIDDLDSNH
jgi:hypothetical protein